MHRACLYGGALFGVCSTSIRCASTDNSWGDAKSRPRSQKATMSYGVDPNALDLNLNFDSMDFAAIARATRDAMSREKRGSWPLGKGAQQVDIAHPKVENAVKEQDASLSQGAAGLEETSPATDDVVAKENHGNKRSRAIRGILGAAVVHDTNSPAAARQQRKAEGAPRYTLMDILRDCSLGNNWMRAYKLFEVATEKACRGAFLHAAVPDFSPLHVASAPQSPPTDNDAVREGKENECFAILRRSLATLPPPTGELDRAIYRARRRGIENLNGILRWNGGHYYMLLKILIEANALKEAERVWTVMKKIGVVEYQLDVRAVNGLLRVMRRGPRKDGVAIHGIAPAVLPLGKRFAEDVATGNEFRRGVVMELEHLAEEKNMTLSADSVRILQSLRASESLRRAELMGNDGARTDQATDKGDIEGSVLRVKDFSGLLRRATSEEATKRALSMMEKMGVERDSTTYASIIASLHNPQYEVLGAETLTHSSAEHCATADDDSVGDAVDQQKKALYEAHKDKRVALAQHWFALCQKKLRTADVYNEMLYLLRGKRFTTEFNALLQEFRGNLIRSDAKAVHAKETPEEQSDRPPGPHERMEGEVTALSVSPQPCAGEESRVRSSHALLSPHWITPPNGKTYELLIQRCRYVHDWPGMWALHKEMNLRNVRGTSRLYQLLLAEVERHPPAHVYDRDDVYSCILELYAEMRRHGIDVTTVDNTISLVNAWSSTRGKHRRL